MNKVQVQINGVEWIDMVRLVARTMCERNAKNELAEQIFRYGDRRVHLDDSGVAQVIDRAMMRHLLAENFAFFTLNSKDDRTFKSPPIELVDDLLCPYYWHRDAPDTRELTVDAVYRTPVILPDGTLLAKPGYDVGSGLVLRLAPSLRMPVISDAPTLAEARQALAHLQDWLRDFPFEDQASATNTIGFLLTPILRPLFGVGALVPLFVVDAPTPGSGKGLLIDFISTIAGGEPAATVVADADDAEQRKRVAVILRNAPSLLHYDNLDHRFGSGAVASMLTMRGASLERVLGSSDAVAQPVRTTFCLSGNNVAITGDLPRRVVHVRLDARVERPAQRRGFKHADLLADAQRARGGLLGHVLTIGRYVAQHRDEIDVEALPSFGSFETFNMVIGGALQLLGLPGWLGNREQFEDVQSEDTGEWDAFLVAVNEWQERLHLETWSAADLVTEYKRTSNTANLILARWPMSLHPYNAEAMPRLPKRLGEELHRRRDRVFGGLVIKRIGTRHNSVAAWRIVSANVSTRVNADFSPSAPPETEIQTRIEGLSGGTESLVPPPQDGGTANGVPPLADAPQSQNTAVGGSGGTERTHYARKEKVAPSPDAASAPRKARKPKPSGSETHITWFDE